MNQMRLGDIATYVNGYAFKPEDRGREGLPIIRIQDLTGNTYDLGFYNGQYPEKIEINDGDILISWSASLGVYVWKKGKALLNQHIFKVVFDKIEVNKQYFIFAVQYNLKMMESKTHGATMKHIVKKEFDNTVIPFPDLMRQTEIANMLSKVENMENSRKRQLGKMDNLIKARFIEMFGDTECNKKGYPIYQLSELCTVSSSKRIYQSELSNFGVPFLRISNLVELIDTKQFTSDLFISEGKYDELFVNRLVPNKGDILVTSRGTLGRCYIVQKDDRFYFQDGMISWLYDFDKKVNPLYLAILFETRDIKQQIDKLQSGSTVAYLSIAMLKKINIVVPPLELQNEFLAFAAQVDKSKAAVKQSLEKLETLKKSLMQKYFG